MTYEHKASYGSSPPCTGERDTHRQRETDMQVIFRKRANNYRALLWKMTCNTSWRMTDSTDKATPPKSTKSRNSNSPVQIQIKPNFQFECVPRNAEKSEFLDLVGFGGGAIPVETVIYIFVITLWYTRILTHSHKYSDRFHVMIWIHIYTEWLLFLHIQNNSADHLFIDICIHIHHDMGWLRSVGSTKL